VANLIVAVDLSKNSRPAARAASWLCRELGLSPTLVYVTEPEVLAGSEEEERLRESLVEWAEDRLARFAADELPGLEATTRLVDGAANASEGIVDVATELDAQIIVMGTHGRTALEHRVLGSTATSVVRHAACDVVTIRPALPDDESLAIKLRDWTLHRSEAPVGTILCPTDFSPGGRKAERRAAGLARRFGAQLHLLHVVSLPFWVSEDSSRSERLRGKAQNAMAEAEKRVGDDHDRVTTAVVEGAVHHAIVDQAGEVGADLIVMGTEGKTGLKRWAIGSDAERVVRSSTVPVWTVRLES